jgi:hypothetical protein
LPTICLFFRKDSGEKKDEAKSGDQKSPEESKPEEKKEGSGETKS